MRRRLFNILSAVSLVLCCATAVLIVWSNSVADGFWRAGRYWDELFVVNGCICFGRTEFKWPSDGVPAGERIGRTWGMFGLPDDTCGWAIYCRRTLSQNGGWPLSMRCSVDRHWTGFGIGEDHWGGHGNGDYRSPLSRFQRSRIYMAPCWLPLLLFALLPGYWLLLFWRMRTRIKRGLCLQCGYDLRASAERCPECGKPMESAGQSGG